MSNTTTYTVGKYEGNAQPLKAAVIDRLSQEFGVDVEHSFGDGHWVGAFEAYGKAYLLVEDSNGFFTVSERSSYAEAVTDVEACADDIDEAWEQYQDQIWARARGRYGLI